jgi:hypothetical protein
MTKLDPLTLDLGDNLTEPDRAPAKPPKAPGPEEKVRILLEDNEHIPPGGQFIQVNGRSFLIQAGYEVEVPLSVLDALDHAVMSVPITNQESTVIGYRDRLRFPYRVITAQRRGGP